MSKTERQLGPADFGHTGLDFAEHEQALIDNRNYRLQKKHANLPAVSMDEEFDPGIVRSTLVPASAYASAKNRLDLAITDLEKAKLEEAKRQASFEAFHGNIEQELYNETGQQLEAEDARDRELHP
jgi:hypothetical protein